MFNTGTVIISLSDYDAMQANERKLKEELANLKDKIGDVITEDCKTDVIVYGEIQPNTEKKWAEMIDLIGFQFDEGERQKALKIHNTPNVVKEPFA